MNSKSQHNTLKIAAASALALGLGIGASGAQAASAQADATAIVVSPISISKDSDLLFGKFAAGSGGTVVVAPNGNRSKTGGVVLLTAAGGLAAGFQVSGDANASYAVTLPGSSITLTRGGGSETMSVGNFQTQLMSGVGSLSGSGSHIFTVGGTLTVGNNQVAGSYAGNFSVTAEYN